MNTPWVNGYLVVSPKKPLEIYRGPDRSPWRHVEQCFFEGILPEPIRDAYKSLRSDQSRGFWWPSCTDLGTATKLAAYSREAGEGAEVIAIYSPYLANSPDRKGWHEPCGRLLGVDVLAVGEWSLLRALVNARDPACRNVLTSVNTAGLLPDASCAGTVEARYRELARIDLVEPIADADSRLPVEAVTVYDLEDQQGK